ncbi:MipA/OmpV family protein, partial [Paraburkholderia sp.]|uniref:MipA/OmpV family protein n=1 Tax=Paraburkholderia sp. TaxID=1926495 RepID=UPI0038620901
MGLACVAALACVRPAWADDAPQAAQADSPWKISIGPGMYIAPEYPGARHLKVYPFPSLDISYRDRIFSQGPDVLGVNVFRGENYHVGASLSFDFQSRNVSDDPHLRGLGNVDDGRTPHGAAA